MINKLRSFRFRLENITVDHQLVYSFLILFGIGIYPAAFADSTGENGANCQTRLAPNGERALFILRAPRELGEIVRFHQVYAEGAVLEFKIYTSSNDNTIVPGYLKDIALLLEGRFPKAAEAIRTHGHSASIEFLRPEQP